MSVPLQTIITVYILLWSTCSFYFGVSGVTNIQYYEEVSQIPKEDYVVQVDSVTKDIRSYKFGDKIYGSLGSAKQAEIADKVLPIYHWLFKVSDITVLILSSCFLGAFGSIIRILIKVLSNSKVDLRSFFLLPFFGFAMGFIVLCISYALPKYLTMNEKVNLNPISIMVIALLAGVYYDLFIKWLRSVAASLFSNAKNQGQA